MSDSKGTKNSRAKIEANKRYNDKAYDHVSLIIPKGQKDIIAEHARKSGESLNAYVTRAVRELMDREDNQ